MVASNPSWIDGVGLDAFRLRRIDSLMVMSNGVDPLGARTGILPGSNGFNVTVSGTTITVGTGLTTLYYAGQGAYRIAFTSAATLTLDPAHATLPRVDLVYLRVWDNVIDGSGQGKADVVYLPGTASSSPSAPTPVGSVIYMRLAHITVPASGGGAPTVNNTVKPTTVAAGGILPGSSAPSTPYVGQYWDDGSDLRRWNGSSWDTYQKVETVGWTQPSLASNYTTGDLTTNGNLNGPLRYRKYVDRGTTYLEWDGGAQRTSGSQVANILASALASTNRPSARASFTIARNVTAITGISASTSVVHSLKVDFNQDGTVGLVAATAGDIETSWFSFKGIRYPL